jgi:hypothetical protein
MRVAIVAFCFLLTASTAYADNFRCPNGSIVSTGDSLSTVVVKCDAPTFVTRREEPVSHRGKSVYIEVQEWTYNEGPDRLIHTLIFRNGTLAEVQSGGFGR